MPSEAVIQTTVLGFYTNVHISRYTAKHPRVLGLVLRDQVKRCTLLTLLSRLKAASVTTGLVCHERDRVLITS